MNANGCESIDRKNCEIDVSRKESDAGRTKLAQNSSNIMISLIFLAICSTTLAFSRIHTTNAIVTPRGEATVQHVSAIASTSLTLILYITLEILQILT